MANIVNLQRKVPVNIGSLSQFAERLRAEASVGSDGSFSIALISDRRMKQLNGVFRGKDATTDVLSFANEPDSFDPDQDNLGDIVISAEQAQRQAFENGLALENELKQLILHGYLHLCGMDHETDNGEMNRTELALRNTLGI